MRFRDLSAQLQKGVSPLWFITGEEPLLMIEAADAIRSAARAEGYSEREVLNGSANWDWNQLIDSCQAMSLFASKKIVEVRMQSFRPGTKGAEILQAVAEMHYDRRLTDVVVVISMPGDWSVKKLAWYKKITSVANVVECDPISVKELPAWFSERIKLQGQSAEPGAVKLLTERCEGNLLAAKQELLKLAYQYPQGATITEDMIRDAVSDVSRFDAENLLEAMMKGDGAKGAKIVESLKAEGESVPSFHWMITEDIREALRVRALVDAGNGMDEALRTVGAFGPRKLRVKSAAQRLSQTKLKSALMLCADIDRLAKGLSVKDKNSDVWCELTSLVVFLSRR